MLIPLLINRLQTPYCSLTNPPFFYKYCLLPPIASGSLPMQAVSPLLQSCSQDVLISLLCSLCSLLSVPVKSLSLVDLQCRSKGSISPSPFKLFKCKSLPQAQVESRPYSSCPSLPLQARGTSALLLHQSPWCNTPFSATPVQFHTGKPLLSLCLFGVVFGL